VNLEAADRAELDELKAALNKEDALEEVGRGGSFIFLLLTLKRS
jgi:hypothetical protein